MRHINKRKRTLTILGDDIDNSIDSYQQGSDDGRSAGIVDRLEIVIVLFDIRWHIVLVGAVDIQPDLMHKRQLMNLIVGTVIETIMTAIMIKTRVALES